MGASARNWRGPEGHGWEKGPGPQNEWGTKAISTPARRQGGQVQHSEEGLEAPTPLWVPPPKVSGLVGLLLLTSWLLFQAGLLPPVSISVTPSLCPHQSDHSE